MPYVGRETLDLEGLEPNPVQQDVVGGGKSAQISDNVVIRVPKSVYLRKVPRSMLADRFMHRPVRLLASRRLEEDCDEPIH